MKCKEIGAHQIKPIENYLNLNQNNNEENF